MARTTAKTSKRKKAKTGLGKWWQSLFCKRTVIIISDHKTQHIPFAAATQLVVAVGALVTVGWASYSSGSYAAAQKSLMEKERKLASTTEENKRVEAEFGLLKNDLMKLAQGEKNGDYAKLIAEQYAHSNEPSATPEEAKDKAEDKYSAVFKRIDYLENKVKDLQETHDAMMADIRATTGGKIKELEKVIARTGMDKQPLAQAVEAKRNQEEQQREKYGRIEDAAAKGGQGGPFNPVSSSVLKEKETELYFNLKRMMTLNDIVSAMPLAVPMGIQSYKVTSGFGTRVDPFRGALAYHSGVDLAGPQGTKILAANDGRVAFAGWKTAYGYVVDVKHEYGFSTRYGHLSRVLVQPDQFVKKGQVIGVQGSTGRSTGNHLHYEVQYQGKAINPSNFLKAGADVRALD